MTSFTGSKWKGLRDSIGPGLLMAGAAVGGSHLIQSTRAGADYGYNLIWAIILANLFKYPFFEYGPRYTAATGESILKGYFRLGKWTIGIFTAFTLFTMFIIVGSLTLVTAGLAGSLAGVELNPVIWSAIVLAVCMLILMLGKYPLLDIIMKVIISVLAVSTIFSVVSVIISRGGISLPQAPPSCLTMTGIAFSVALMGWMPSIVDISVWHSLWSLERRKQTGHAASVSEARIDFNIGYAGSAVLAVAFLSLGALLMSGTGETFSNNGVEFANQLVALYTRRLGAWAGPVILISAFTTMFTTTLTVTDAYPRVIRHICELGCPEFTGRIGSDRLYYLIMAFVAVVSLCLIGFATSGIKTLVDFSTTVSFLTTPVLISINYMLIMSRHVPDEAKPAPWLRILSWLGIAFWTGFAVFFVLMRLGMISW